MKPLSQLLAEVEPIKYPLYDVENYTAVDRETYEKLKAIAVELAKAVEHIASTNYEVTDEGSGYRTRLVCAELFTSEHLDMWAVKQLTTAREMLEGK